MFSTKNFQRLLILLTIISMIPVLAATWNRVVVESKSRSVQFILDSEEVWQMVRRIPNAGETEYEQALRDFRDAGANALAIYPLSFSRLEERGLAVSYDSKTFSQLLFAGSFAEIAEELGEFSVARWYLLIPDEDIAERVYDALADREQVLDWRFFETEAGFLVEVPSLYWNDYRRAGLWYEQDEISQATRLGYDIVLRTTLLPGQTAEQLEQMFVPILSTGSVSMILPTGTALNGTVGMRGVGLSNSAPAAQDFIDLFKTHSLSYGLIENINQLNNFRFIGDDELLRQLDFKAIRIYAIQRAELDKENWLDSEGIIDRWFRAAVDRNIRGIYIRLFSGTLRDPERILSLNRNLVQKSAAQMDQAGYPVARPEALAPLHLVNQMLLLVPALGFAGACFLVSWHPWRRLRWPLVFTLVSLLGVMAVGFLSRSAGNLGGFWVTMRQVLGLGAHLVYPTLAGMAAILLLRYLPQRGNLFMAWAQAALLAFTGFVVTLFGGIVLGNLLTDNLLMLELDFFRGVKVSYILPIILFALWFFVRFGLVLTDSNANTAGAESRSWRDWYQDLLVLLKRPLTIGLLAALGVIAIVGWYYLGRSGHEAGVGISSIELALRSWLEGLLVARPRNKEFLIGYPALMLLPLFWQKKQLRWLIAPAGIAAMTGLISVVNSFAHIRTPLMISIERGFYGLLLGLGIGSVVLLAAYALWYLVERFWPNTIDDYE